MSGIQLSLKAGIFFLLISSLILGQQSKNVSKEYSSVELFEEVWQLCLDHFYSPTQPAPDWEALQTKYRPRIEKASSLEEASTIINLMLSELKTSHTYLYTQADWEYFDLLDMINPYAQMESLKALFPDGNFPDEINTYMQRIKELFPDGRVTYPNIGIFTQKIHGITFVRAVLDGSPAFKAGIVAGDQICSVDGKEYHSVKSFAGKAKANIQIQNSTDPRSIRNLTVIPEDRTPSERYMAAIMASVRIIKDSGYKIGYIHIWSFTGEEYYLYLLEEIRNGKLKDANGLILDLREGWGGANPYYLSPFDPEVPTEMPSDTGMNKTIDFKWNKPVVFLVNEKTRSGKETLVYAFKQKKLGTVVGTTTAGANVSGRTYLLKSGGLLLLAIKRWPDVSRALLKFPPEVVKNTEIASDPFLFLMEHPEVIEGKGIEPDISIRFPIEYAQGHDPQLAAAVKTAVERIRLSMQE